MLKFDQPKAKRSKTPINLYESLRPVSYDFCPKSNNTSLANRKQAKSTEFERTNKILKLERTNKEQAETIAKLREENQQLREELEFMRNVNKNLMEGNQIESNDLHLLYQNLFITDLKKQMGKREEEAEYYRLKHKQIMMKLRTMSKDKKYMTAMLKRQVHQKEDSPKRKSIANQGSLISDQSYEEELVPRRQSFSSPNFANSSGRSVPQYSSILEFLKNAIQCESMFDILSELSSKVKSIFKCEKASIFLVSEYFKKAYEEKYPHKTPYKTFWNGNWIYSLAVEGFHTADPTPHRPDHLIRGHLEADSIAQSITFREEIGMIVQAQSRQKVKGKSRPFTSVDLSVLGILALGINIMLELIQCRQEQEVQRRHVKELTEISTNLLVNRSHKGLANQVYHLLPKFFDFESAGIVYLDKTRNEFFKMVVSGSEKEKFLESTIYFPSNLGLTGEVYNSREILVYENVKNLRLYYPEVDNSIGVSNLRNCIMGCLKGPDDEVVGVLQLFNKKDNREISQEDIEKLKGTQVLLGMCIAATNVVYQCLTLTIGIKSCIGNSINASDSLDMSALEEMQIFRGQMHSLKSNLQQWARRRK